MVFSCKMRGEPALYYSPFPKYGSSNHLGWRHKVPIFMPNRSLLTISWNTSLHQKAPYWLSWKLEILLEIRTKLRAARGITVAIHKRHALWQHFKNQFYRKCIMKIYQKKSKVIDVLQFHYSQMKTKTNDSIILLAACVYARVFLSANQRCQFLKT